MQTSPSPARTRSPIDGPAPSETVNLTAADGTKLHVRVWPAPPDAKAMVAMVHGYAEHGGRYAAVAARLAEEGYASMTVDVRGHGKSGGQRGHVLEYRQFLSDFDAFLAFARDRAGDKPTFLLGHSHGGLILLRRLVDGPLGAKVDGVILTSPFLGVAMKVPAIKVHAGRLLSKLMPKLSLANEIPAEHTSHHPDIIARYATDPDCFKIANARWFTEASAAQAFVQQSASRLVAAGMPPILLVQAGDDKIASPAESRRLAAATGPKLRYVELPGLYHEVLNEVEREQAFAEIWKSLGEWLAK